MSGAAYQPMVIQHIYGQPWQRYDAPPMLYAALEWISRKLQTVLWNRLQREVPNPFNKDQSTRFDTEGLSIHGYDREDDELTQPWNLKCGDIEVSWYRHSWCNVSVNKPLTNDQIAEFLETALAILDRCNVDHDYYGKKGEQAFQIDGQEVGESSYQKACREEREAKRKKS